MLLKFVIILSVIVYGLIDANEVSRNATRSVTSAKPEKSTKVVTDDDDDDDDVDVEKSHNSEDCAAIYANSDKIDGVQPKSGVYTIYPNEDESLQVYCDMETDGGGWTVIQRRGDYRKQQSFFRTWADYKKGFGSRQRDYWLGNDIISILTQRDVYNLRFDLADFDGKKLFAEYSGFRVADESDKYRMTFDSFIKGDAPDSFTMHKEAQFSTIDQNNDNKASVDCSKTYKGGWWYKGGTRGPVCYKSNLNGVYLRGNHPEMKGQGVIWYEFGGQQYSLKVSEMKIRPASFKP